MAEKQIVPILTLSGGVSRQPATKRTPFQAENLDNCLVTLERSVEKRPGFSILPGVGEFDLSFLPADVDPFFTWYQLDKENRFLIIINRAAASATDKIVYIIKVSPDGWINQTPPTQWDPKDSQLVWNGTDIINEGDPRKVIYDIANANNPPNLLSQYNTTLSLGVISRDSRNYLCYSQNKTREVLKSLQFGTNILFLNTKVYAGFTSGTDNSTVTLGGQTTGITDIIGGKVTYYSGTRVVKTSDGRMYPQGYTLREGEEFDVDWTAKFIPVEDYVYGDFEKPWLGQSVRNFGELRFPPDNNDWVVNNSNSDLSPTDESARNMLKILYDPKTPFYNENTNTSQADGRGKIYFCDAPYLSLDAGYYRIISFTEDETFTEGAVTTTGAGKPYTQKVRSPDNCSVIDKKRMPQRLVYTNGTWKMESIDWTPRTIGDRVTNPGPSPFLTSDGEARHVQISSICNFRDRLFFSSGDIVFSSQLGILEDLWIKDPSNVTVSDPIDVRAASNNYAEITAMIPFDMFLFINTRGGIQFELKGDNNLISPLTAEISTTTFYSTADLVDPLTLGSQIFFFDKQRLYIYLNQESREFNTAVEVSNGIRGYLPTNYQDITTAVAQNYLLAVDEDAKNNIYIYCNRFDGGELIQSAFWRYVLSSSDQAYSIKVWDDSLYTITKRIVGSSIAWYIQKTLLEQENLDIPRIDSRSVITITPANTTAKAVETTITVPYLLTNEDAYVVLSNDFGNMSYSVFKITAKDISGVTSIVKFSGIDLTEHIGKRVYIGNSYEMIIELSPIYLRDNSNNIIEGMLNLKTLQVRHNNTGTYKVEVERRGRSNKLISEFSATDTETTNTRQKDGIFVAKVFGFSDETNIKIINNKLSPCNITQMEFKAIFNKNNSSLR